MRILLVTATDPEIRPLLDRFEPVAQSAPRTATFRYAGHTIDVLTTGVGMVATAVWTARASLVASYDLALNVGVCGAFDGSLEPGAVVHVTSDRVAELGAEDGERFISVHELQLLGEDEFPFRRGMLVNTTPPANPTIARLPAVAAITVNTVHGNEASIAAVCHRYQPQVESMEGAAFMYACLVAGLPFAQVRAVSNVVERRNRGSWKLAEAIAAVCGTTLEIVQHA